MSRKQSKSKPEPSVTISPPSAPVSAKRRWLYRVAAVLLLPLISLGVLELGLRVGGYGFNPDFFKPVRIGGKDYLVQNDSFGLRFFPPELARSPAPLRMEAHKPAGTYRIFVLGESAALGDPRPAYGAARYLQVLLHDRFPGTEFEVICAAVTAINSHALLPIARECARHEGDFWIVYMGNNEFVGPFGATSVFGRPAPPVWVVRFNLVLQRSRVGQLLMRLGRGLRPSGDKTPWTGMEMFVKSTLAPDDPKRAVVTANFARNLADILQTGTASGVPIFLSTVAVNLKDSAPFASWPPAVPGSRGPGEQAFAAGQKAATEGDLPSAQKFLEQACESSPTCAQYQFSLGQVYAAETNAAAALRAFQKACDLDALPFRADSAINGVITAAARDFAGPKLDFFDAAHFFATNGPAEGPGQETFYEHVHFNFDGNYRLARAWAAEVEKFLPEPIRQKAAGDWASQAVCERRLGLSDWNRVDVLDDMLRRCNQPPLSAQVNNRRRMEQFRAELKECRARMDVPAAKAADAVFLEEVRRAPEDFWLHENFAQFLEDAGDVPHATEEWKRVRDLLPYYHLGWFETGRLLSRQGQWVEAKASLEEALKLRPDLSEGWMELGEIAYSQGDQITALSNYEKAQRLLPQDPRVYYRMGKSLVKLNRHSEAVHQFSKAIGLDKNYWEPRYALGEELAFAGNVSDARFQFEQVIKLKPNYALAHLNLGVAMVQQKQLEAAAEQFKETLRIEPENKLAKDYLEQLQKQK